MPLLEYVCLAKKYDAHKKGMHGIVSVSSFV